VPKAAPTKVSRSLWRQRTGPIGGLVAVLTSLAACTSGPSGVSPSPDAGPVVNPVSFCGYLERPAVANAIITYLGSVIGSATGSGAGGLVCGDVRAGTAFSRGGKFSYAGQGGPSVVVSLDILGGGLPDETLAGQKRVDDGTDPTLSAWCGDGTMVRAGQINAFRIVPANTLPIDMTGNQQLVVTVQIHGYPSGTCAAGWALFRALGAAGALDEKQFTRF
jgi:hypothetical protein